MERSQIIKLSKKDLNLDNLEIVTKELTKDYEISIGNYDNIELKKAISDKKPFFIKDNFIIGINPDGTFINIDDKKISIEKMVKAVIVEDEKEKTEIESRDKFAIIGKNEWDNYSIADFNNTIARLCVGEIFLPKHSVVVNFLNPSTKETKEKIVSELSGVNINIYNTGNYVDNCIHEIGHLFWRTCLRYEDHEKFKNFYKSLKPSAIYEYEWERENEEEAFCTIYKWYVKSLLINRSFYNILEYEEKTGLDLLLSIFEHIKKEKIVEDIWELNKYSIMDYLNPKFDKTTGKYIVKRGQHDDIKDIEVPVSIMDNVNKYQNGIEYIMLGKANVPLLKNKIDFNHKEKNTTYVEKENGTYKRKIKPVIYIEMDNVVADVSSKYRLLFNSDMDKDENFVVRQNILSILNFYRYVEVLDNGIDLINTLKNDYELVFLSYPFDDNEYKRDKLEWFKQNIGNEYSLIFSNDYSQYALNEQSILLDVKENVNWPATYINIKGKRNIREKLDSLFAEKDETVQKRIKTIKNKELEISNANKINYKGIDIFIDEPKGHVRWGIGTPGQRWICKLKNHYGYVMDKTGNKINCIVGPNLNKSLAFVITEKNNTKTFMVGYNNEESAIKARNETYHGECEKESVEQTNTKKIRELYL
jgi:hypothetical protein